MGVVGPVGGGGGREESQAPRRPQSNQEEADGSLGSSLVPWTPGDENDTSLPRPEGPQKVSASRVPARGCSFPRARHAVERTSPQALLCPLNHESGAA